MVSRAGLIPFYRSFCVQDYRLKAEVLYLTLGFPVPTWSPGARSEKPCAPPDSWAPVRRAGSRAAGRRTGAARRGAEKRPWRSHGAWPGQKKNRCEVPATLSEFQEEAVFALERRGCSCRFSSDQHLSALYRR